MNFCHSFTVRAPFEVVARFHSCSASMGAITPPPMVVQMHHAPILASEGDLIDFTLWLGPLPVNWVARIEQVTPISFVDRQVRGPFRRWVHLHTFVPVDSQTTRVIDLVEGDLRPEWCWRGFGVAMWMGLPLLFAYRQWRTKRLLERIDEPNALSP
jgi:ligand-binding SRPBCC domain-containing protein